MESHLYIWIQPYTIIPITFQVRVFNLIFHIIQFCLAHLPYLLNHSAHKETGHQGLKIDSDEQYMATVPLLLYKCLTYTYNVCTITFYTY